MHLAYGNLINTVIYFRIRYESGNFMSRWLLKKDCASLISQLVDNTKIFIFALKMWAFVSFDNVVVAYKNS